MSPARQTTSAAGEAQPDRRRALEVEGLEFAYGRLQVLFGIDLHVDEGEALALLGTNGAGKSTLLRVVCGLEQADRGSVRLDGIDISRVPAHLLVERGLVLVPGGRAVFADMSVSENLAMQTLPLRKRPDLVRRRMERVMEVFPRLRERREVPAGRLSGGEQQQLALAKALLLDPRVLCIDELSLGLAPIVVEELLEVVRTINASGVGVVLVEQSLNIASEMCTRAVFLEKGEVRFEGHPRELLDRDELARAVFLGGDR